MEALAVPSPLTPVGCDRLRQQVSSVKINGQPVPFIHPDKDPQRVLGVLVTPTLNWGPQTQKNLEEAKLRASNITESDASPRQTLCVEKLLFIQCCLKPYLTYGFPITYLKNQDIYTLDAILAQSAKRALRLPLATPTGLMLQQQVASGAGVESLLVDYAQLGTVHLMRALNDVGRLGTITRSLMHMRMQQTQLGTHSTWQLGATANHHRLIKQLELATEAGLYARPAVTPGPSANPECDESFTRPENLKLKSLDLATVTSHLHTDPRCLGETKPIAASVYHLSPLQCADKQICAVDYENPGHSVVSVNTMQLYRLR